MRWEGRRQSDNVTDSRGQSGGIFGRSAGMPGGGRIRIPSGGTGTRISGGTIVIFVVVALGLWIFAGINPLVLISILSGSGGAGQVVTQQAPPPMSAEQRAAQDEEFQFASTVLAETEDTWNKIFEASGSRYEEPRLNIYSGAAGTGCGFSSSASGPFYCPNDRTVYLDLTFFQQLDGRLGAPGDFAQAYVIAHEVGHHVQNLTGVLGRFAQARGQVSEAEANRMSVAVELQADCYAGIWAHSANAVGIVESGDVDEALGAASAVGDDTLQRRQQGYVVPESFNHGTAEQRRHWFDVGFRSGNPDDCDTGAGR